MAEIEWINAGLSLVSSIAAVPRSSSRRHSFFTKKSVGICICYRPSVGGFSHCLSLLDGNAEAHACICNQDFRTIFLPKYRAESIYYISTGIYRCSTLDRE
ncbi:hypothetical protein [Heminiphilus faecis]|uniref:hypothetical protein n=1 Tax=Heminiphilus faecis TaxID=2601703 RepID=UPI0011C41353|nr:hypothetical protein [Heminiphilus faecis]